MGFLDLFKKTKRADPTEEVDDVVKRTGQITGQVMKISADMSAQVPHHLPTEQDVWWFLAEQYDRCVDAGDFHRQMLAISPLTMHEIEYEGRRSEDSYVGKPNPGISYFTRMRAVLAAKMDDNLADIAITQAYCFFVMQNMPTVNALRKKYAEHFHGNCIRDGAPRNAGRWQDVIDEIENS